MVIGRRASDLGRQTWGIKRLKPSDLTDLGLDAGLSASFSESPSFDVSRPRSVV
jgi:hypothetical protein